MKGVNLSVNNIHLFSKKKEEMFLNSISSLISLSESFLSVPLKPDDFLINYSIAQREENIIVNNTFYNSEVTVKEYNELTHAWFQTTNNKDSINYFNEFFHKNEKNEILIKNNLYPVLIDRCKLDLPFLYLLTSTGEITEFAQNNYKGNYSVYFFYEYEHLANNLIGILKKLKDCIRQQYKDVFIIIGKDQFNEQTFYHEKFKKLFEDKKENLEIIQFFKFLVFNKDEETNPFYSCIASDFYTYFILNPENIIIKTNLFDYNIDDRLVTRLKKVIDENYQKTKEIKESKKFKLLSLLHQLKKKTKSLPYLFTFLYSYEISFKLSNDLSTLIPIKLRSMSIEGKLRGKDFQEIKELGESINSSTIKIQITSIEECSIDINKFKTINCSNSSCGKVIPENEGMYYCYWCSIFYCEKCVEDSFLSPSKKLRDKLIHKEHNLLYFVTRNENDLSLIDKEKLGTNLFARSQDFELTDRHYSTSCSGCKKTIGSVPRYICLSCKPGIVLRNGYFDYCYHCFSHLRKGDEIGKEIEKIEEVIHNSVGYYIPNEKYITKKHKHKHHVYLCLILQVREEYFNF